jgi:hypothetical protein
MLSHSGVRRIGDVVAETDEVSHGGKTLATGHVELLATDLPKDQNDQ